MNKKAVEGVQTCLQYVEHYTTSALTYAKEVKDPELVKKVEAIKAQTENVKAYIVEKTDPKTFG